MATKKKMLQAAAGQAGGDPLDITDVFSTYLYDGVGGSGQTINNGIDLAGKGGLVWFKQLNANRDHGLFDTARGQGEYLVANDTNAEASTTTMLTAFNSNGFTLGGGGGIVNNGSGTYASWTFRKARKFFDVVTWTGTGGSRAINHNLGSVPGMIIVKWYNVATDNWTVYHRGLNGGTDPEDYGIYLNVTNAAINDSGFWNDTAPTSTQFTVGGSLNSAYGGGGQYIAYVFAHNDGDGGFGPDGDQDIIKCGNFTTQSSAFEVDLGFEPQWIMLKLASAGSWYMYDVMRGIAYGDGNQSTLYANQTYSEFQIGSNDFVNATPTGFKINQNMINQALGGNQNVVYMAIRRGSLAPPESATEVFNVDLGGSDAGITATFPVDLSILGSRTGNDKFYIFDRLRAGKFSNTTSSVAEVSSASFGMYQDGPAYHAFRDVLGTNYIGYNWKRAPGYFDAVAYTGTGSARTVSHNLTVAPEMMWVKSRSAVQDWDVYHAGLNGGNDKGHYKIKLNSTGGESNSATRWNDTAPSASNFTVGTSATTNGSGSTYIAYLFASLDGISKVGSFSHINGTPTNVDCGFSSGARFVLWKSTSYANGWVVFDTVRGIVAGNDPYFALNDNAAESTSFDIIDPTSSGFQMTGVMATGDYIFYAIA